MPDFRRGSDSAKQAARSKPTYDIGPPFEARFPGWCRAPTCGDDIEEGDVVQYVEGDTWHQDCVTDEQQPGGVLA